jgi:D-amino peptidase
VRVYILTDLEGVAGVERWDPHRYGDPAARRWKDQAVELLAGEVRAAVEGALEAGATSVLIRDGHGHGDDLPREGWPQEVELIQGVGAGARPGPGGGAGAGADIGAGGWLPGLDATVDALLLVGQHAREGAADAVLAHSWSRRRPRRCWLDGVEVGEAGAAVFLAAELGVPTAFLAGDRAAVREARDLVPGIVWAEVKRRDERGAVVHLSGSEARKAIRAGVRRALASLPEVVAVGPAPHVFREVFVRPPLGGVPFLAARLGGGVATRALLRRAGRWPQDGRVTARVADRRTLEYRGPTVAGVLGGALG